MKIKAYDEINAKLTELADKANFIPDASTKEGYEKSKRLALDIRKIETNLEKVRKQEKDFYLQGGKQVDTQAKAIQSQLECARMPHHEAYKAIDNAEKIKKQKRMSQAQERIDSMQTLFDQCEYAPSSEIAVTIETITNVDTDKDFWELSSDALMCKTRILKKLGEMYIRKQEIEQNKKELDALIEKQRIQDQKDHDERIAKEASERAEKEKQAAIDREEQAKRDQLQAEQEKVEAEKRAIEVEKQAKIDAENAKVEAQKQADIAAENARLKEIERQNEQARVEQERIAKLEADKKHTGNIRKQSKEDLMSLDIDEETAKKIVMAINKKMIRNISITY